jgi:hypothetical protein
MPYRPAAHWKVHHQDTKAQRFRQERQKNKAFTFALLRALASLRWGLIPIFRINAVPTSRALKVTTKTPRHKGFAKKGKKTRFSLCAPFAPWRLCGGVDSDFQD